MKIKIEHTKETLLQWGLLVVVILLSVFSCTQYKIRKELKAERQSVEEYFKDSVKYYKNKYGQEVATKKVLIGDKDQLEVLLSKQVDSTNQFKGLYKKYKNVKSAGIIETITKIDTIYITYDSPLDINVGLGRDFKIDTQDYFISGTAYLTGLTIDRIYLENKLTFIKGVRKNGWFKPNTYSIDVAHSNPHIQTTGIDSYLFTPKKNRFHVGPAIGYDFITGRLSGGVSIMYSVISF
jgi:hypothetical protein